MVMEKDAKLMTQKDAKLKNLRLKSNAGSGIKRGWGALPGTADMDRVRTPASRTTSRGRVAPGTADSSLHGSSLGGGDDDEVHDLVMEGVRAALLERTEVTQTQQVRTYSRERQTF